MFVIGVDPGFTGAMALINHNRQLLECADLPVCGNGQETGKMQKWLDVTAMQMLLANWRLKHDFARDTVHAVIERPIATPAIRGAAFGIPVQTTASQFDTFGVLRTLMLLKVDHTHIVNPAEWKKLYDFGRDKDAARACCQRLYPDAPVKRVRDHNRAEAILIGHWYIKAKL